ncbi:hypothetical protein MNBD_NITROSPINAE02-2117 [hydrothermal vent metagenome]|uniref:DUF4382 domain-containing protein n=1 Tax=hydrothermal vent metagenome TaxID=652676 RepID=A0A3B1C451_9ZZZZ
MKFSSNRLILAIIFFVLTAGCAGTGQVPGNYRMTKDNGKGLAIVSLTRSFTAKYSMYEDFSIFVSLRGVNSDYDVTLPLTEVWVDGNESMEDLDERLAVFELPEGQYEFYNWKGYSGGTGHKQVINSGHVFSKRFRVKQGKVAYLGNLHMVFNGNRYMLLVMNLKKIDLKLFQKQYPGLMDQQVAINIMR